MLDFLPAGNAEPGSRARFFAERRAQLEDLGLSAPESARPTDDFASQAHQREHFDDLASRQDRFSYSALGLQPFQRALRSLTFDEWKAVLPAGSLVLDVGCSDGLSTFDAARLGARALGFDVAPQAVRSAAARARRESTGKVSFMVADADAIPVANEVVDCVLCFGSLHHLPRPSRSVAEMARVLREGGSYLGVENNTTPLRPLFDLLMRLRPLWLEEAGARAQIGAEDLRAWSEGTRLQLQTRATVFVPPHLCNLIGERAARRLLRWTDRLFGRVPLVREWGGLISIRATKVAGAAPPTGSPRALARQSGSAR